MLDVDALSAALSGLAGSECACAAAHAELVTDQLFPAEREHVVRAVAKRQAEFGTARVLARRVLATLDIPAQSLVPTADRSPRWPAGIVGSISHSNGYCAVVVSRATSFIGIGVDLETARAFDPAMQAAICTPGELAWLRTAGGRGNSPLDALVFSAKESFYKCQYALTQTSFGFHDVALQFDLNTQTFHAGTLSERVPQPARLKQTQGSWCRLDDMLITLAILRP